ncbi:hypothetical protein Tco_1527411, partial [Tanacetum coccineum]
MASQFPLTPSKLESDDVKIFCDDVKYVLGYTCSGQLYSLIVLADNDDDEEEFLDADETLLREWGSGCDMVLDIQQLSTDVSLCV